MVECGFLTIVSEPSSVFHGSDERPRIAMTRTDATVQMAHTPVKPCESCVLSWSRVKNRAVKKLVETLVQPIEAT